MYKGYVEPHITFSSGDFLIEKLKKDNKNLKRLVKKLEHELFLAKTQESLTRPIADEYGKAS